MRRGAWAALLTAGSLLSFLGTSGVALADRPAGPHFRDIGSARVAAAVDQLALQGVIQGTTSTTFDPNGKVTREQLAALLVRYLGDQQQASQAQSGLGGFSDHGGVASIFRGDMAFAVQSGFIQGNTQGQLNPTQGATRAQVVAMLLRALGLSGEAQNVSTGDLSVFHDAGQIPGPFVGDMALAYQLGLIQGMANGNLDPNSIVTRAEIALILARAEDSFGQASQSTQNTTIQGTVTSVSQTPTTSTTGEATQGSITLQEADGSSATFGVATNAVFFVGGQTGTLSQVTSGDSIVLVLDASQNAVLVQASAPQVTAQSAVRGTVVSYTGSTLVLQTNGSRSENEGHGNGGAAGATVTLTMPATFAVTYQGQAASASDIVAGDSVTVLESAQGQPVAVIITRKSMSAPLQGTIVMARGEWIMIVDGSGNYYRVYVSGQTAIEINGQTVSGHVKLRDIAVPGDTVTVSGYLAEGGQIHAQTIDIGSASTVTAPTGLAAQEVQGGIALDWTAPQTAPAGYQVLESVNGGAYTTVSQTDGGTPAASATSTEITGLTAGQSYTFELSATNSTGTASTSTATAPVQFGGTIKTAVYTPAGAAVPASGSVTFGVAPQAGDLVLIDGQSFQYVATGANAASGTFSTPADLVAAIAANATTSAALTAHVDAADASKVDIAATATGIAGNSITLSTSDSAEFTVSGATLTGGMTASTGSLAVTFSQAVNQSSLTSTNFGAALALSSGASYGTGATGSLSGSTFTIVPGTGAVLTGATITPSGVTDAAGNPITGSVTVSSSAGSGTGTVTAPAGLAAHEVQGGIDLSWTVPQTAPAGYQVLESVNGGAYTSVSQADGGTPAANATAGEVTGLTSGDSYAFELSAVTSNGTSLMSGATTTVQFGATLQTAKLTAAAAAVAATGSVTFGAAPVSGDVIQTDGQNFQYVATGASAASGTFTTPADLVAAITANATTAAAVEASVDSSNAATVDLTAKTAGSAGNSIAITTSNAAQLAISGATLTGGADATPATVTVTFSQDINPATLTATNFTTALQLGTGASYGTGATGSLSGQTFTIVLGTGASVSGTTITPVGIQDAAGNAVTGSATVS